MLSNCPYHAYSVEFFFPDYLNVNIFLIDLLVARFQANGNPTQLISHTPCMAE